MPFQSLSQVLILLLASVLVVALAMGLQASAVTHFGGAAISTVVVTSTLARTADAALDRLLPGTTAGPPAISRPSLLVMTWGGYLAGAVAGALLLTVMPWPLLVPAALDAVKDWVYRPTLLNGNPITVETTIDINFTLSQ